MKFAIALFAPPHAPSARRALRFAQAALAAGHEITRLFFYQDGVHSGSHNVVTPQDELDMSGEWRKLVREQQLDGVICIAAARRRRHGREAANLAPDWELSGLGQLHEAMQVADRLICFGGH